MSTFDEQTVCLRVARSGGSGAQRLRFRRRNERRAVPRGCRMLGHDRGEAGGDAGRLGARLIAPVLRAHRTDRHQNDPRV